MTELTITVANAERIAGLEREVAGLREQQTQLLAEIRELRNRQDAILDKLR